MKIESQDKRIDELLKGNTFLIPRFQRAYSWEADHISDFWGDVLDNLNETYFIGSMVVYEDGRSQLAVVDGQQRLTTITILLCAIRDGYRQISEQNLANGLQSYIEQKDRENRTIYVLQTETSFPYLQEEILKDSPAEVSTDIGREEEAIQRAYEMFVSYISDELESFLSNKEQSREDNQTDAATWLSQLRDTVFDLNVILVTLDNEDDAYLIFETLNTRGKDLALSDLLRNHFSKYLKPSSDVDHSKIKWGEVLDTISSSSIKLDPDTFIVHSWQSRYDFVTKAKAFQKIKQLVTKKNAKSHLDRFLSDSGQWRSIFDTDYQWEKNEKKVARSLEALRIFKVVQPSPGLLSVVRAYRDGIIKLRQLIKVVELIETFHFSFNAITSSRSSGGISGMYASFGQRVFNSKDSNEVSVLLRELETKLRERVAPEAEFDAGFEQVIYTNQHSAQRALVRYILKKIAKHEGAHSIGDSEDLTIEHLLPQQKIKAGASDNLIGQIGNLLLIDQETNLELATKSFKSKKKILLEKGYKLPQIFMDANELSEDLIKANTRRLSALARDEIWKI